MLSPIRHDGSALHVPPYQTQNKQVEQEQMFVQQDAPLITDRTPAHSPPRPCSNALNECMILQVRVTCELVKWTQICLPACEFLGVHVVDFHHLAERSGISSSQAHSGIFGPRSSYLSRKVLMILNPNFSFFLIKPAG